ncbi:MAG: CDP-alcohol phosphatidyltransferase family protein [Candidatus Eisenbacteria bacterium]|uniref:CDP-alcohol phosphatidyltransferase family protein n=1 Tax=Eiseniibacteriota bacterium TaxID=2212470 RepID=A0A9D6QNU4_UNCEI|nr:CDP-alcohol phosphatidyltransferase family protein [Candidatus Eisenbacteria bacterium]MBI3539274.1 CDP-alcohol phosphatidyltransferase family protein [Candidatus Eisenbacteria bacterium]
MFVEEYLRDLRRDRFAPAALLLYARRLAARVREEIYANPGAVRSVWNVALAFFAAAFLAAVGMALVFDRHLAYDFFLHTALWIVPAFTFVTLFLELLRDADGYRLSALNVPVTLTLLRITLVPGIVLFVLDRHDAAALIAYGLAAASDVADGWIARRWKQITRLGTVLDPLVDIVFNLALFFALAGAGLIPMWVFGVAAARYAVLLVGGACLYLFVGPVRIYPTLFGRLTGVVMAGLVALLLLLHAVGGHLQDRLASLTEIALGVMLSATVVQVVVLGWYNLRVMSGAADAARGRVVGDVRWGAP